MARYYHKEKQLWKGNTLMRAAMLKAFGQPLTLEDIPEPVPAAGEVLVRVLATPVLAYAQEVFTGERNYALVLPLVPGSGAIGLVEKTGPDATRLQPGIWQGFLPGTAICTAKALSTYKNV